MKLSDILFKDQAGKEYAITGNKKDARVVSYTVALDGENAKKYLAEHPEIMETLDHQIREHYHFGQEADEKAEKKAGTGRPYSIEITLPPLACVIFYQKKKS